jgi:outer membrane immunogenic protein
MLLKGRSMKRVAVVAGVIALGAAGPVWAADLPQAAPPPPRAPAVYTPIQQVYNWSGIYFGVNAGAAFVNQPAPSFTVVATGAAVPGTTSAASSTGFAGGGQLGFNYQINQIVLGAEADADYLSNKTTINGIQTVGGAVTGTFTHTYQLDLLSTVRGRVGVAFDRSLFYATAGLAMGEFKATRTQNTGVTGAAGPGTNETYSTLRLGWTAGSGYEYAITDNWTARAEYLYASLESITYTFPIAGRTTSAPAESVNVVRAGVNYKF